jgi:nucleotide-binding universal stress UspA family protein
MPATFNKILIPVDFSLNTEIALKKAIGLAGAEETTIHLLHVTRPGKKVVSQFRNWVVERDLQQLKYTLQQENPGLRVRIHVMKGFSIQGTIIECAAMINPDLIIIAKQNSRRRWWVFTSLISPDVVAKKSNCPVLTAKPGSMDSRTKVIVLPIRNFLPERKLEWAVLLAKKYKAQVHLLAIQQHEPKDGSLSQVFLKAYHLLREKLHHPIEYSASVRHNAARAALNYAELIMADMILVNPETESGISGLTGTRHISDMLNRDSKIQVLDVEPYEKEILLK